jgi:hypothetical protein
MRRIARSATGVACIGVLLLGIPGSEQSISLIRSPVRSAWGQTETELTAARQLFAEALSDEQAGRHAAALEKFQRVQAVRDTQAVRYRIATCLEALGQLKAALAAYTSTSVAAAVDAESSSIARASRDKVEALSKRIARLVVTLSPHSPPDTLVKVDGEAVPPNTIGTPLVLDPGLHEVLATSSTANPFHARVTLGEGAQGAVEATLTPLTLPPPSPPAQPPPVLPPKTPVTEPPPPTPRPARSAGRTTAGITLVAAGGVLVAGATAVLLVRHSDIQSLESACPDGVCPLDQESALESMRNRALIEGPVGVGLGVAGAAAAVIGVYLLATKSSPTIAVIPWVAPTGRGAALVARF